LVFSPTYHAQSTPASSRRYVIGVHAKFERFGVGSDVQDMGPESQLAAHPERMNWWAGRL